jgi:hypothetical protein
MDNQLLKKRLSPFGYHLARHKPGLWLHKTRPIAFSLIVDDSAVKYVGKQHAAHLRDALLRIYELTTDWEGKVYSGMMLKWDYKNRTCDISMPGYVANVLSKFQHDTAKHPQHTPSRYVMPVYGAKTQYATQDETPPLTAKQCLNIHKVKVKYAWTRMRAIERAWLCFRYNDTDHTVKCEHECTLLRLPRTMVSMVIFP